MTKLTAHSSKQTRKPKLSLKASAVSEFERGTSFSPELLALRAAAELRSLLRQPQFDEAMATVTAQVAARAERCWLAQPRWRAKWSRAATASPLMVFFRHWTAAATQRMGLPLPACILSSYALGHASKPHRQKASIVTVPLAQTGKGKRAKKE